MESVKVWQERVVIPTYEIGDPEKYPIFLEKRVYQGSSGSVYPHPVIEKISDEKIDKEWEAVFLENKYVKIMVLPALGGRIQMAYDKLRERHFVYYNHVIKPALVGLTGPWISGGIEFNWPQHHRPSTYDPVDFKIEENADGSCTVWVSEVERMFRTKGMAGFTLHPDKAYLEIKAQLYNRTPHPQTFLWWANPAVAVNDHYQSVFPPDVNAVFDHGKRDVSRFPIATGTYYKMDYSAGVDISRYKNIPVPTSYMAITSEYDFVGGYENDSKGGLLHVADHHVSPGKKQWTWGNGDFGHAWDRNLTDSDGPYIELMCGVYTDNQPDFSWIQPYEEKSFTQYFMPYYNVGVVKNATKEALLNLEQDKGRARIRVYATSTYRDCSIVVSDSAKVYLNIVRTLSPDGDFDMSFECKPKVSSEVAVVVKDASGRELVSWKPEKELLKPMPVPAKAAKEPQELLTNEQLYLQGLHLEQYRHATYDATAYYKEALKRDPRDVRNNNAMGLWYLKRGKFELAADHFQVAIDTLTERNPNPYDGEPYFNLGIAKRFLGDNKAAYDAFFKACWNAAWQDAGYFHLAQLECGKKDYQRGTELVERSLIRNSRNHKSRHLKVILLRKQNLKGEAMVYADESLVVDHFNFGVLYERYLLTGDTQFREEFTKMLRGNVHNYIEYALDYAQAGCYQEAIDILGICIEGQECYPMVHYFLAQFHKELDHHDQALWELLQAAKAPSDYCFPNRLEEVVALQSAITHNPDDPFAHYYLGNFWYASRQYTEAMQCWSRSLGLDDQFPIVHRNLALMNYNKLGEKDAARELLETAFRLDKGNARVLMELDQLYKKMNVSHEERKQLLEDNVELVVQRDDLYLERVALCNLSGDYKTALELISQRQFHPWEGGEGKVPAQYLMSNVELAKQQISLGKSAEALAYLENALMFPHNLGEGKLYGAAENDVHYWKGVAYDALGEKEKAEAAWLKATEGLSDPSPALFYNDQQPDKILYQGLAHMKLGNGDEARRRFNKLIDYGEKHIFDKVKIDYFAVSLPDLLIWEEDLNTRNIIHCKYLIGLGLLGLGQDVKAMEAFQEVLDMDRYHAGAHIHFQYASSEQKPLVSFG